MNAKTKKNYWIVAGTVLFEDPEGQEGANVHTININQIIEKPLAEPYVGVHDIGRAQQGIQLQFFDKLGDPNLIVRDVFIVSISHLGVMTEAQFRHNPNEEAQKAAALAAVQGLN